MIKIFHPHGRALVTAWLAVAPLPAAPATAIEPFIEQHCAKCHDEVEKKAGLDLTALKPDPGDAQTFAKWVAVHDRVRSGEMPPKKREPPPAPEREAFVSELAARLVAAEQRRLGVDGRSTQRRLNRYEYENAVRDLLEAPWLQVKEWLPEDGEAYRFNKVAEALDVSHVQMARYLGAADYALRQVIATSIVRPDATPVRHYAREQRSFTGPMKFSVFNQAPERATFPVLGTAGQPEVRAGKAPLTVGAADPRARELEGVGVVASSYEPLELKFTQFKAPAPGHYRLRFNAHSVWVGPGKPEPGKPHRWWIPNLEDISPGRRPEPITVYSETPPRQLRHLGKFDVTPQPAVHELDVWLLAGETIRVDAARLFRSRPGAGRWQNPLAEPDGQPGVAFRWLEVDGPLHEEWPSAGHQLLFSDLPLKQGEGRGAVEVVSSDPRKDAERLLRHFMQRAYRRPLNDADVVRFVPVVAKALELGDSFMDAMVAGYTAVLCSPEFVCLQESPGALDDYAVAARLSFWLWNSAPDDELRALAARGALRQPEVLRAQTNRLLEDPKSRRFVKAFLDYWLDLRKIASTAPDSTLYPDYYLDDLLSESALEETRLFFAELVREDLPARNLVSADFAMLNERLAVHYGLPPIDGVAFRRVALPPKSVRGGLMTQASVLKVTANGTTTSPVLRGAWVRERLLGKPPPPPPPNLPAVEPDIRGTATIRQQLEKHRDQESCSSCHANMDPPGLALESFDVMGGWRERYRALGDGAPEKGIGKGGQKFAFHLALPVDCAGELADGRPFANIQEFMRLLLEDETQIARNLGQQLVVYATGAPVRFGDRPAIERILERARTRQYGVRSIIHEIVQSELFLNK